MSKLVETFFLGIKIATALLLAGMVVLVFGNVFLRYAFNTGITVSEEIARWFFVWLIFLGAIVGLRERSHLAVTTLVDVLPRLGQKGCFLLKNLMMLGCTLIVIRGSWTQTLINWSVSAPATGLSVAWFYGVGLAFGVPVAIIILHDIWRLLAGRLGDGDLVGPPAGETT